MYSSFTISMDRPVEYEEKGEGYRKKHMAPLETFLH